MRLIVTDSWALNQALASKQPKCHLSISSLFKKRYSQRHKYKCTRGQKVLLPTHTSTAGDQATLANIQQYLALITSNKSRSCTHACNSETLVCVCAYVCVCVCVCVCTYVCVCVFSMSGCWITTSQMSHPGSFFSQRNKYILLVWNDKSKPGYPPLAPKPSSTRVETKG